MASTTENQPPVEATTRPRRRIFEPLPISVALVLALFIALIIQADSCVPNWRMLLGACTAVVATILLWVSHVRFIQEKGWKKLGLIAFSFLNYGLRFVILLLLCLFAVTLATGSYDCRPDRAVLAALVIQANGVKAEISRLYADGTPLNNIDSQIALEKTSAGQHLFVTRGGVIIVTEDTPTSFVIMTPHETGKALSWSCHAAPSGTGMRFCTD